MNTRPRDTIEQPRVWIGLDVSKATLDACLMRPTNQTHAKQFPNTATGHAHLLRWVTRLAPDVVQHFCLEATGSYSTAIALFLAEADVFVSVVNPARLRYFALMQRQGNKTDQADAQLIAQFCRKEAPALWRAASEELRVWTALVRRLDAVQHLVTQEQNRLAAPAQPDEVLGSIQATLAFLTAERERIRTQIRAHVAGHPELKRDVTLLMSIPGIGELTAWTILTELPDVQQFDSAQAVAAYAGLAPREHRSGSSVYKKTRLSKQGNSRLRTAMYFPAVTAVIWNPLVKAHYERLRQAGKAKMVALAAAMRKLLMICYGVLKHQQPFQATGGSCPQSPKPPCVPLASLAA